MMTPQTVVPAQFFHRDKPVSRDAAGYHRLWLAALALAIDDFFGGVTSEDGKKRHLHLEARRWIFEPAGEPGAYGIGFDSLCEGLRIDADAIRQALLRALRTGNGDRPIVRSACKWVRT